MTSSPKKHPVLIRATAALCALAAVGACSGPADSQKPPPTVPPSALAGVLLDANAINSVMGTTAMVPNPPFTDLHDDRNLLPNVNCLGIWQVAETGIYGDTGFTGVRGQRLRQPDSDDWDALVVQSVVSYPSADAARAFFQASSDRWSKCTNHHVNITVNEQPRKTWNFGDLTKTDAELTMPFTRTLPDKSCQRALSVVGNVILDIQACASTTTDQAAVIAKKIDDRLPR